MARLLPDISRRAHTAHAEDAAANSAAIRAALGGVAGVAAAGT